MVRQIRRRSVSHRTSPDGVGGEMMKRRPHHRGGGGVRQGLPWFIYLIIITITLAISTYILHQWYLKSRVNIPLHVPKLISTLPTSDDDMLWGSYRPGVYFGLSTRHPDPLVTGFMWFRQDQTPHNFNIRHWCSQDDRLDRYGWRYHDGTRFGLHKIDDGDISIEKSFIKHGKHSWTANISLTSNMKTSSPEISLLFYVALNGTGRLKSQLTKKRLDVVHGVTPSLGDFTISFPSSNDDVLYHHLSHDRAPLDLLKEEVVSHLAMIKVKKDHRHVIAVTTKQHHSNHDERFIIHQVTVRAPYSLLVEYKATTSQDDGDDAPLITNHHQRLTQLISTFNDEFERIFHLSSKGFSVEEIEAAQSALSNMLGSLGYFHGSSLVTSRHLRPRSVPYGPHTLYTGVPSRSFFPRGFLWDEGFHQLLVARWNPTLTMTSLAHWLDTINSEGWIPREQILGVEAEARVPQEFIVQHNENANPPTFFLTLQVILDHVNQTNPHYLHTLYPRLSSWFTWFNTTQLGSYPGVYRWHGREAMAASGKELNAKTLTSGLDDFPRASHPTDSERHVDLRCWMALAAQVMYRLSQCIGVDGIEYNHTYHYLTDPNLLDELHWSDKSGSFSDWGLHTDSVRLARPPAPPGGGGPPRGGEKVRVVDKAPRERFVDAVGYVSLFPLLLLQLSPDSPRLAPLLTLMSERHHLWTDYGLRSLSASHLLYGRWNTEHDPPYWRGSIWINMNYLAVRALHHYSQVITHQELRERCSKLYSELRRNLLTNIVRVWRKSGYVWEQYDDRTGAGKGSHPFTGWSALYVLIMAEIY